MSDRRLLKVGDVADILNVSTRQVWRLRDSGKIPKPLNIGRCCLRWDADDLNRWIEERIQKQREKGL